MIKPIQNIRLLEGIFGNEIYIIKEEDKVIESNEVKLEKDETKPLKTASKTKESKPKIEFPLTVIINQGIKEEHQVFLEKILKAIKLDFNKINLITENINTLEDLSSQKILSFGVDLSSFDVDKQQYEIIEKDKFKFINADNLSEISQNVNKKRQLWTVLQKLFPAK